MSRTTVVWRKKKTQQASIPSYTFASDLKTQVDKDEEIYEDKTPEKLQSASMDLDRSLEDDIVKEKIPARLDCNNQTSNSKPKEKIPARLDDNQTLNPNPNLTQWLIQW